MGTQDRYVSGRPGLNVLAVIVVIGLCVWVSNCVDFGSKKAPYIAPSRADTPQLRAMAAELARSSGYWCDTPTKLTERSITPNRYDVILVCDGGDKYARYEISVNPNTGSGSVRPL